MTIADSLIEKYLNRQPSNVTVVAAKNASTIPLYSQALQNLTIQETLPGCDVIIVESGIGIVRAGSSGIFDGHCSEVSFRRALAVGFRVMLARVANFLRSFHSPTGLRCPPQANMTEILTWLLEYGHIYVPVRLQVNNPMNVEMHVVGVNGYVTYNDSVLGEIPVGYIDYDLPQGPNITIPAAGTSLSPAVPILMLLTGAWPAGGGVGVVASSAVC